MIVFDLRCVHGHGFEGWFGSDDEFMDQNGRGLVECPLCADKVISRMPTAPRLNLSGAREAAAPATLPAEPTAADIQAMWMQAVRQMMASTEDVGPRFADIEVLRLGKAWERWRGPVPHWPQPPGTN